MAIRCAIGTKANVDFSVGRIGCDWDLGVVRTQGKDDEVSGARGQSSVRKKMVDRIKKRAEVTRLRLMVLFSISVGY